MPWRATPARSVRGALLAAVLAAMAAADAGAADRPASPPPAIPHAPAEWETLATGLPEQALLVPIVDPAYNRVDGPAVQVGVAVRREVDPAPLLYVKGGYAISRERALGAAGFEAPLGGRARLRAGADAYRRTATEDRWIVGDAENTIFALLARTDYRDWYEAEGLGGRLTWTPGTDASLEAAASLEEHASLRTRTRIAAFGGDDKFRDNPPIVAGTEARIVLSARIGPAALSQEGGSRATLRYERAGGPLGRDFDYGRLRGAVHASRRLSERASCRARLLAGSTRHGLLPPQRTWHLGGIGTLRGHEYKALSGDQFALANGEAYLRLRRNVFGMAFLDWGAAWFGDGNTGRQRPAFDGGVGIRLFDEPGLAVTAARDLKRDGAPILIGVRLGAEF